MNNKLNNKLNDKEFKKRCKRVAAGSMAVVLGIGAGTYGSMKNAEAEKPVKAVESSEESDFSENTKLTKAIKNNVTKLDSTTESNKVSLDTSVDKKQAGNAKYKKDENIYGILKADGTLDETYVVNQFEVKKAGNITDIATFDEVSNLTNTEELNQDGKNISFYAEKGNFYYQGSSDNAELPWDFEIKYYLDDKNVSAGDLAGADGEMKITIKSSENEAVDDIFYENYMLQVSMTLNNEQAKNIHSKDATVADAGESRQYNYTVMPGDDADITLKADIEDFEMGGISIAAIPFSMTVDMPDSDSMLKGMNKLTDGVDELDDGVGELRDGVGEYADGMSEFSDGLNTINDNMVKVSDGGNDISEGSSKIADGLNKIGKGGDGLKDGSKQIGDTLQMFSAKVGTMDLSGLAPEDAAFIMQVAAGLSKNYSEFDAGIGSYVDGVNKLSKNYSKFDNGLHKYTNGISKLSNGVDKLADGGNELADGGDELYDGICELKDGTAKMANGVAKMPAKTEKKIDEMMSDYVKDFDLVSFVDADNKNINAVQFTITTPEIKKAEVKEEVKEEKEESLVQRFVKLFKK